MTFEFIIAVVFVVSAFILGYTAGKNGCNDSIREALKVYSKDIEKKLSHKYDERLESEVEKAVRQAVEECNRFHDAKEKLYWEKKKERLLQNQQFEAGQPEQNRIPKSTYVSDDAFKLWALMTSHYEMERSLDLDGQIQTVCQRITSYLLPHELDVLFQIDREVCDNAGQFTRCVGGVTGDDVNVVPDKQ